MQIQCTYANNVICVGNYIYLVTIETPHVKHPWSLPQYTEFTRSGDEGSIYLYQSSFDEKPFLSVTDLKKLPEGEWYRHLVVPGTRWELEIIICPTVWIEHQN